MKKTALITGAGARIGAAITKTLHDNQFDVIIHYNESEKEAQILCDTLNNKRPDSARKLQANLDSLDQINHLVEAIETLDLLVNNASKSSKKLGRVSICFSNFSSIPSGISWCTPPGLKYAA